MIGEDLPIFTESNHSYVGTAGKMKGRRYTSVSTLIKKYEPKKDWKAIADRYAAKNGFTGEYWQDVWKKKNLEACDKGHEYHSMREQRWIDLQNQGFFVFTNPVNEEGWKQAKPLEDLKDGVHSELMIWNEDYEVCGQADEPRFRGGELSLNDYKTNIKLNKEGFRGEMMIGPLKSVPNSNYWHYVVQLSTYAYLMELRGYKVSKLTLEYVTNDCEKIELPYLRDVVKEMLEDHKSSLNYSDDLV